jgi:hypothetical protein
MTDKLSLSTAATGIEGWHTVAPFDSNSIEQINDGQGGDTATPPTSIPSPFARIDLVKAAFLELNREYSSEKAGGVNRKIATPNSKKLVSKTLDLAELLFNYNNCGDAITTHKWTVKDANGPVATKALMEPGGKEGHRKLGAVFQMFLDQDAATYNFDKIDQFHIFSYDGKVIGGTSPATLLFTAPCDKYLENLNINFGTHTLFDKQKPYVPLYQRDVEFQKMWFYLKSKPNFRDMFPELNEYLENQQQILKNKNRSDYDLIFNQHGTLLVDDEYVTKAFTILDTGKSNDYVQVNGISFYKRNAAVEVSEIEKNSEFLISSSKYKDLYPDKKLPMILQKGFNVSPALKYTHTTDWSPTYGNQVVPFTEKSWQKNERELPGLSTKYPWLTINDLLEPYIIKLNNPLNKNSFVHGTEIAFKNENMGFLPVFKKDFFDFFDIEDLTSGRVKYTIQDTGQGDFLVQLQIPINKEKNYITLEKEYSNIPVGGSGFGLNFPNLDNNEGFVIDQPINVIIYPPLKSTPTVVIQPNYTIQLTYEHTSSIQGVSLEFYQCQKDKNRPLDNVGDPRYRTTKDDGSDFTTKYYKLENEFDLIKVKLENDNYPVGGYIIPIFTPAQGGNRTFSVAIDFGTTSSHVELRDDKGNTTPLHFDKPQLLSLAQHITYKNGNEIKNENGEATSSFFRAYRFELLPELLGGTQKFPIRTVISEKTETNHNGLGLKLFSDFSIPFYYEKEPKRRNDELRANLKWEQPRNGQDLSPANRTNAFLEELVLLVRNKILFEGGNLSKTTFIWTYPSSMANGKRNRLRLIWEDVIGKYFGKEILTPANRQFHSVKESIAPYYYLIPQTNLADAVYPVISVDIGGGTTDTVVHIDSKPAFLSSFRFAGNDIFGDGYRESNSDRNGFVQRYKKEFESLLENLKVKDLSDYNTVLNSDATKKSEDVISFWFSIEKHPEVEPDQRNDVSFNRMLANDSGMKITFLIFYTSIIYHITWMLKKMSEDTEQPLTLPGGFVFSGTASKILSIITNDKYTLEKFTKIIIEKIYNKKYSPRETFEIFYDSQNPKEATCRGVLKMTAAKIDEAQRTTTETFTGIPNRAFEKVKYEEAKTADYRNAIIDEVEAFYKFFFELDNEFSFEDEFEVDPSSQRIAKDILYQNTINYFAIAVDKKIADLDGGDLQQVVEDTLFFAPIKGSLNALAYAISQNAN